MRANEARAGGKRTFIETARRDQIVAATIETLAEVGYGNASLASIAKRAGLSSTGLITYHFTNKGALIEQVVGDVLDHIADYLAERAPDTADPRARLHAYIVASIDYIRAHTSEMKALLAIFLSGAVIYDGATNPATIAPLEQILTDGKRSGAFRQIDTNVAAALIQRSIDGIPLALDQDPGLDLDAYADSLLTLIEKGLVNDQRSCPRAEQA